MPQTLSEFADWLDGRGAAWPSVPEIRPVKATPFVEPLEGIKAVTWSIYGTLMRITDGQLTLEHPTRMRMQVALEKTIREFNMWNSMIRKPGAPWEYLYSQYTDLLSRQELVGTGRTGDFPQVDAPGLWQVLVERLQENGYTYDESFHGDLEQFSEKVAWFFHSSLQGVTAAPGAREAITVVARSSLAQALLADAQPFTLVQLLRVLRIDGTLPPPGELFDAGCVTLSCEVGVRTPSPSLYQACLDRFAEREIEAGEILHVGSRLRDDLAVARGFGMRTALYAGDQAGFEASKDDVRDAGLKPDRLLTELSQIRTVLSIE